MKHAINNRGLLSDCCETKKGNNLWRVILYIADIQASNETRWFTISLVFQSIILLPVSVALIYYCNASVIVLLITSGLFLSSLVVGMRGSGIRFILGFFAIAILVNLMMLAFYIL